MKHIEIQSVLGFFYTAFRAFLVIIFFTKVVLGFWISREFLGFSWVLYTAFRGFLFFGCFRVFGISREFLGFSWVLCTAFRGFFF